MQPSNDAPTSEFVAMTQIAKYEKKPAAVAATYQFLFDMWVQEKIEFKDIKDILADLVLLAETKEQECEENFERHGTPYQLTGDENHSDGQEGGE